MIRSSSSLWNKSHRCFLHRTASEFVSADTTTYASLLQVCDSVKKGKEIHAQIIERGVHIDGSLAQNLLLMYIRCGSLLDARQLFSEIPNKNVVSWTSMVGAYAREGYKKEAFRTFREMQLQGVQPNKVAFIAVLNACSSPAVAMEAKQFHNLIIDNGLQLDVIVGTALVNMCGRCQTLEDACNVFNQLQVKDVIAWNAMMTTYFQHGKSEEALILFQKMQLEGVSPDIVSFLMALSSCARVEHLTGSKLVHRLAVESGLAIHTMVGNSIIDMYGKCGNLAAADETFEKLDCRDVVSWNTLIAAYCQHAACRQGLHIFRTMHLEGIRPDSVTFNTLLHGFESRSLLIEGRLIHTQIDEAGMDSYAVMSTALVSMYAKCGSLKDAMHVFKAANDKDIVLWNTMVALLAQAEEFDASVKMFRRMQLEGVMPNKVTFTTVINVCANLEDVKQAKRIYALVVEGGLESDAIIGNAIIDLFGKCGKLDEAWNVYERMGSGNVVSLTAMIASLSQYERHKDAIQLFWQMLQEGIKPSSITFITVLYACMCLKEVTQGKLVHACIDEVGLCGDVTNAVLSFYGECGSSEDVCRIFNSKQQKDLSAWNAVILAYAQERESTQALQHFRKMQIEGIVPDKFTYLAVLEACADSTLLRETRAMEVRIGDSMKSDHLLGTGLLKSYSRCGGIFESNRIFRMMAKNDMVSWSAIIAVYANHGNAEEAFGLFCEMQLDGIMPSDVTFVSIFAACSHSGKVEKGYECFLDLKRDFGVQYTAEHYKCMIDMLGRAGRLEQAEKFMRRMPFKADVVAWTTMLGACRVHGDMKRSERAAGHMIDFDIAASLNENCLQRV